MAAPQLNRRLVLEEAARVADGAGGFTEAWLEIGQLWAALKPGTGREKIGGTLALSAVPYEVVTRAAPFGSAARPRPDQRFRDGARLFRILAVADEDAERRYLTCHCVEEVSG